MRAPGSVQFIIAAQRAQIKGANQRTYEREMEQARSNVSVRKRRLEGESGRETLSFQRTIKKDYLTHKHTHAHTHVLSAVRGNDAGGENRDIFLFSL
jgi:hypothetical protein